MRAFEIYATDNKLWKNPTVKNKCSEKLFE